MFHRGNKDLCNLTWIPKRNPGVIPENACMPRIYDSFWWVYNLGRACVYI